MTKSEYQELVEFLAEKFGRIDRRFDGIDERFEQVDRRFDGIDERFGQVDRRFDGIDERFGQVDRRLDGIDERFRQVDWRFDGIDERFGRIDRRFDGIDERFEQVDRRFESVEAGISELGVQVERNRDEIRIVAEGVTALDEKFERFRAELEGQFREQRELLVFSHRDLDRRVTSLEERVDRLEAGG